MVMNFDAIMLCSYGGPRQMDDVLPFMRNATRGRGIPDERLLMVSEHYKLFGGSSPINERNEELRTAIASHVSVPVVIGNRNWTPYFTDTLRELDAQGLHRVLCIFTAAYASYSGCRQYRENLAEALTELGPEIANRFTLSRIPAYFNTSGFFAANVDAALAPLAADPQAQLVLVTHSIPTAMNESSGNGVTISDYKRQHLDFGMQLCTELSARLGREIPVDLAFCSRSGPPHQPWLEPDINDRLAELKNAGVESVVVLPIGFIHDHMEVVYDLDTEAKATARNLGLRYARAATAGVHPQFIASLVELIEQANIASTEGTAPANSAWSLGLCGNKCCLPHRQYQVLPTLFHQREE
ncbi:ferrochelatase [Schaalia sp. ZJ1691]|uniref:ferrochelatase n=1 Tax=Schaalia sp. ZJ1691 TaxID=2709404 RepID=UPI001F150F6F|nr:ferrochelatase [Schaalia sp. ZJ1691]